MSEFQYKVSQQLTRVVYGAHVIQNEEDKSLLECFYRYGEENGEVKSVSDVIEEELSVVKTGINDEDDE